MPPHPQARAGARGAAAHATGAGAWGREPALEVARCCAPTATEAVGGAGAAAWSQIACHDGGGKGIHCQHGYPAPQSRVQGHCEPGASLDHARDPGAACLALAYHRSPTGNMSQESVLQYFDVANCVVGWLLRISASSSAFPRLPWRRPAASLASRVGLTSPGSPRAWAYYTSRPINSRASRTRCPVFAPFRSPAAILWTRATLRQTFATRSTLEWRRRCARRIPIHHSRLQAPTWQRSHGDLRRSALKTT